MAYVITDACINCEVCEPECPNEAISAGADFCEIDPGRCTECVGHYAEPQCIAICPIDCIVHDQERTETQEKLREKYSRLMGGGG